MIFSHDLFFIFSLWLSTFVMGWISWPIASFFFGALSDRGYTISKLFGWVAVSYLVFVLATLKIVPLALWSLILVVFVWALINFFIEKEKKCIRKNILDLRQILLIELFFLLIMGFFAYIRAHSPEIYSIERFMDFGFLKSLFNARALPISDMWMLGEKINYYYFGHFMGYVLLSVSRIPPISGFFVLIVWMFAVLSLNIYRLARDLTALLPLPVLTPIAKKLILASAGIISSGIVLFAGTLHTSFWLFKYGKYALFHAPLPSFWYPDPTRIIPGTITEMPIYSFLVADLHPHVWGLLIGILVLLLLFLVFHDSTATLNWKNKYLWLLGTLLGLSYITNSWDALTLGSLTIFAVWIKWHAFSKLKLAILGIALALGAYIVGLPWSLFQNLPIEGIGLVRAHSPLLPWLSFWGLYLALCALFLGILWMLFRKTQKKSFAVFRPYRFHLIIIASAMLFLALMEIFYVKDILAHGEWFRANTVFKITTELWLWLGAISGSIAVWSVLMLQKSKSKMLLALFLFFLFLGPAIYPAKAIFQAQISGKKLTSFGTGLNWWEKRFPSDFEAYQFLSKIQDALPANDKIRNIVEAEGESYTDVSRFSVFLGWPTIIGWPVHEWTWRGTYDNVGKRREEVREIYTGKDTEKSREILQKYRIDYIIAGELEGQRYGSEIKKEKLKKLGNAVFDNGTTFIIKRAR